MIPNGVEKIGSQWFKNSDICSVSIPASVRRIEPGAFYKCEALKRVVLNEGLVALGDNNIFGSGVFQCSGIEEIVLPTTLTETGCNTFRDCASLRSVRFQGS